MKSTIEIISILKRLKRIPLINMELNLLGFWLIAWNQQDEASDWMYLSLSEI